MYNNWTTTNIQLDEEHTQFPLCLHLLPEKGELYLKNANFRDRPHYKIAFLDLIPCVDAEEGNMVITDLDGIDTMSTIEQMKILAKEFVLAINSSGMFEKIEGQISYSVVYNQLDVGVTGVCIEIQLRELVGYRVC